ncbi:MULTISPECIES: YgiQ family radical SAM protein [Methanothrix]|uniref:Radical SAM N-terminal domain protein n=1 Tax=Methanothrix thermoacetophila (strain DSM 6194 / JCM 14653 / NBRC 101360 / PT) TaxID=349307 RepID=A0B9D6_METTP|nr:MULTISPECIES: YgiQ family radical SAM protein [Methanothrix]ABK15310.1 Radical SAM N-terminal domain protein [Methanothrix thermoacetophila PT]NPU87333.1 YgiQ family radical SAM protein [Methanothrix sp.]
MPEQPEYLPISRREMKELGVDQLDVILVTGDAYVDHPSFGAALIGRVLWDAGFTVGIIPQPDWRRSEDFKRLGEPRLFFGVTAGNVDSMVNAFTPNLKRRSGDVYSPGGEIRRPDRATLVYADRIHSIFPGRPVVLGGIEASLRRFAHYDYWSDSVRRSIIADAPADLLVFGMGELAVVEIASRLERGESIGEIRDVRGTVFKMSVKEWKSSSHEEYTVIPSFDEVSSDKRKYAEAFRLHYMEQDPFRGRAVVQPHPKTVIVQNPPARPLKTEELDRIYELPYIRREHPSYRKPVPALESVRFSITSHRGCFGSCSFCALTHHQGRIVQSRSIESILKEARRLVEMPGFRGVIQDVGGPTADMYGMVCALWERGGCGRICTPECDNIEISHRRYLELLRRLKEIPGVRHVFVSSGIRHDLVVRDEKYGELFLEELCREHVSGHLKIAPEHISESVTRCMHKPPVEVLDAFMNCFRRAAGKSGREEYVLPYLMSGHPGCTVRDMIELAEYMRDHRIRVEQVQDFTPTPMTVSTTMYHTGLDPFTMKPVHVPRGREKMIQRALLQYWLPQNRKLVREGLISADRTDLIGDGPMCLVPSNP